MPSGDVFLILPVLYIMNQIDWTLPQNVMYARILYAVTQVGILGFVAFIASAVNTRKEQTKIKVPQAASWGSTSGPDEEQTVQQYDLAQIKKYAVQVLFGAALVVFFHFKWNMIQPLFIQAIMNPLQLYKNPLFQIFVMGERGEIEKRPFKEENPFAAAFSGMAASSQPPSGDDDTASQKSVASSDEAIALPNGPPSAAEKKKLKRLQRAD